MKILLLDIETAPNVAHVWGMFKQNIGLNQLMDSSYTMCYAAKWLGSKSVSFDSVHVSEPEAMLEGVWDLLDQADAVIHYNGQKFDIPTLNKEFLQMGWAPPSPYHQIDLLQTARKQFKFPTNRLDYVSQMLGFEGKKTHEGHTLWVKCMADDPEAWAIMEAYNIQDVQILEEVYNTFLPWIKNHPNHALYMDADRPVCPNCGSEHVKKNGTETTKLMKYQRYRCTDCGTNIRGRTTIQTKEERANVLTQSKL